MDERMEREMDRYSKRVEFVESEIKKRNFEKRIKNLLLVISSAAKKFNLKIGKVDETSKTDGKNIWLSLPFYGVDLPIEKIYSIFIALSMHEMEHVLSTNMDLAESYRNDVYRNLFNQLGRGQSDDIAHYIFNSIEDGRIERRAANRTPGYAKCLKWFRYLHWYHQPILAEPSTDGQKLQSVLWALCTYATYGSFPRRWLKVYDKNSEETQLIMKCMHDIDEAVASDECKICLDHCYNICEILKDYILSHTVSTKELEELLKDIQSSEYSSSPDGPAQDDGTSIDGNISVRKTRPQNDKKDDSDKDESKGKGDDNSGEKGEAKKDADGKDEKGNGKSSGNKGEKSDDNADGSANSKADSKERSDCKEDTTDSFSFVFDEDDNGFEENDKFAEETGKKGLEKTIKDDKDEGAKKDDDGQVDKSIIQDLGEADIENLLFEIVPNEKTTQRYRSPKSLEDAGKVLNRNLSPLFKFKKSAYSLNRRSGMVDINKLTKLATDETNIFKRKNINKTVDAAIYILIDASGSMHGYKWTKAMDSSSVLELGIKDLMPFKIATFQTSSNLHTRISVIKDFDDKPIGYTEKFRLNNGPNHGNRDGLAIRLATEELMKRPEELKILIVISDGEPSAYSRRYESGVQDVMNAVKESRKRKIHTYGIYINGDREGRFERYKTMYGNNALNCSPQDLATVLPRVIRKEIRNMV